MKLCMNVSAVSVLTISMILAFYYITFNFDIGVMKGMDNNT